MCILYIYKFVNIYLYMELYHSSLLLSPRLHNRRVLLLHAYIYFAGYLLPLFPLLIRSSFVVRSFVYSFGLHLFQFVTKQLVRLVWTSTGFTLFFIFSATYTYKFFHFLNIFFSYLHLFILFYFFRFVFQFAVAFVYLHYNYTAFEHVYLIFCCAIFCYDFHLLSDSGGFALAGTVLKARGIRDICICIYIHTSAPVSTIYRGTLMRI